MGWLIFIILFVGSIASLYFIEKHGKNKYGEKEWQEQKKNANEEMFGGKGRAIKCPNCGHLGANKISTVKKSASVGVFGLASDKIGKTYECPCCKYIW